MILSIGRSIVIRRFFFLIGTLYLYRCVTMYITTLPVPGMHMNCAPKVSSERIQTVSLLRHKAEESSECFISYSCFLFGNWLSHFQLHGDSQAKIQRILQMVSGGGLSITNSHLLCGDFLYSGHTVMLTLTYLFIKECEYSNQRFWCFFSITYIKSI